MSLNFVNCQKITNFVYYYKFLIMKRLIYTFALLFVAFSAMGANLSANKYIYFANTDGWTTSTIQFMIGHDSWSQGYEMTKISNTNLYYWKTDSWGGYTEWAVFGADGVWGGEGSSVSHRKSWAPNSTAVGTTAITANYNLVTTAGAIGATGTLHTFLNKTHTIESYVDNEESSAGGTIKATSYKLNSATTTTTTATSGTTSIEAVYTATITLTASANAGYEFIGWHDNSDKLLSSEASYSYVAGNSATTIKAKFRKLAVSAPQILTFTASATEIDVNTPINFTTTVENADSKDVVYKCNETVISNPWTPTEGGEYTITANLEGATSKSINVIVYAATIYFDNNISGWSNVYAYCWNSDDDKNAAWPGMNLSNPDGNIYTYKSTKIYKKVIFTNNREQTADLDFENGKTYSMPKPVPFVAGTKELCGSEWNSSDENNAMEEIDGVFSKTYTDLPAGEYEFKVVYEGEWYGIDKITANSTKGTEAKGDDGKNIGFQLIDKTNVTISFDISTKNITIIADGIEKFGYTYFNVGDTIYFSTDNKVTNHFAAYFFGPNDKFTWVNLEQKYENIYALKVPEGEWSGVTFCDVKSENNEWGKNDSNINTKIENLRYEGKNWYVWTTGNNHWRNFENIIFAEQKLYFKPDTNWESDGARFAAYYWDILGENKWADCVYNEENDVYEVISPAVGEGKSQTVWTNLKFLRMNPDFEDNKWNNGDEDETGKPKRVWNDTKDLTFDGINDLFIIKLTKEEGDNLDWNSADVNNWVSYSTCFQNVIFFQPNEAEKNNRFSIWLWNGFNKGCWAKFQPLENYNNFYYVVIPDGFWTGANICSMKPETTEDNWENKLLQTSNLTYHKDKLLYKVPKEWIDDKITDDYWCELTHENGFDFNPENVMEIKDGVKNGAYYQAKKYTMTIASNEVNKWHWISLPYDVNVADIKSNITTEKPYGTDFIMKRYDTATRAAWESEQAPVNDQTWVQLTNDDVLKAGRGYILGVNNSLTEGVTLTFPANSYFHIVADQSNGKNDNIESLNPELNINSNWHLIGTGLYGATQSSSEINFVAYPDASGSDYNYYYLNNPIDNNYFESTQVSTSILGMYRAFFVQYSGEYTFSTAVVSRNMAPRHTLTDNTIEQYYINIVSEKDTSRTAILLAEDGSEDYVIGEDFLHFGVTKKTTQLYTKQNGRLLSFNHLKKENCVVELGGYVVNAGEYTISLIDNGASSIVLIDNYTGESVDLSIENYTFTTEKGSLDGRFSVAISYIEKDVTTQINDEIIGNITISNNKGTILIDGLNIGDNIWIYDTVGRCVNHFVANNNQKELNIETGVYILKTSVKSVKFIVL